MAISPTVAAAGGVVWRGRRGDIEVALVHRPRYDDWTLPKGKLEDGESELAAAVREVGEELGAAVAVSRRVGRVHYRHDGAKKTVAYWAMRYLAGEFVPNDEVDAIEWLTPAHAAKRLTYAVDLPVLADFAALPVPDFGDPARPAREGRQAQRVARRRPAASARPGRAAAGAGVGRVPGAVSRRSG